MMTNVTSRQFGPLYHVLCFPTPHWPVGKVREAEFMKRLNIIRISYSALTKNSPSNNQDCVDFDSLSTQARLTRGDPSGVSDF